MKGSPLALIVVASAVFAWSCSNGAATKTASPAATTVTAPAPAAPAEDVPATITQLEHDWVAAIVKKDIAAIDQLLAPEFVGTSPTAYTFNRSAALDDLKSGKYVVDSMNLGETSVNVYGNVAVAFTSQEETSRYDGKNTSGHYLFTDVWAKKDGRWQVVASHGTRYAESRKAS